MEQLTPRRFPPPWTVEERGESFIVHDASGQARLIRTWVFSYVGSNGDK
jgi:hypothetical protein